MCGSGYGASYLRALCAHERYDVVGLLSRGSPRSHETAKKFGVLSVTAGDALPPADIACVAVAGAPSVQVAHRVLRSGMDVLLEHPLGEALVAQALDFADAHGRRLHVNSHFADIEPVRQFIEACQKAGQAERPEFVTGLCSSRTRFSLLDIMLQALRADGCGDGGVLSVDSGSSPEFRTFTGELGGTAVQVTETTRVSDVDDGTDQDRRAPGHGSVSDGNPNASLITRAVDRESQPVGRVASRAGFLERRDRRSTTPGAQDRGRPPGGPWPSRRGPTADSRTSLPEELGSAMGGHAAARPVGANGETENGPRSRGPNDSPSAFQETGGL